MLRAAPILTVCWARAGREAAAARKATASDVPNVKRMALLRGGWRAVCTTARSRWQRAGRERRGGSRGRGRGSALEERARVEHDGALRAGGHVAAGGGVG